MRLPVSSECPLSLMKIDDRVLAQAERLQLVQDLPDVVIGCRDDRAVGPPGRILHVLVEFLELLERLLRVVRNVERHVEEKRPVLVLLREI